MTICMECTYAKPGYNIHEQQKWPYFCTHDNSFVMDYVDGVRYLQPCKERNTEGNCKDYEAK